MNKEKLKELLEERLVLLEDDDEDTGDDDTGGDEDDDDEDEAPDLDVGTQNDIKVIKSTVDLLIKINLHLINTYSADFNEINAVLFKIRYNFIIFINNFESYEPDDQKKIIKAFKDAITAVIQEMNKMIK